MLQLIDNLDKFRQEQALQESSPFVSSYAGAGGSKKVSQIIDCQHRWGKSRVR